MMWKEVLGMGLTNAFPFLGVVLLRKVKAAAFVGY
jgi:hypothetical protein